MLKDKVNSLLRQGQRNIVLDLACPGIVSDHPHSLRESIDSVFQPRRIRSSGDLWNRC